MGFGPKAGSVEDGVQAVRDLMELLYPERAGAEVLDLVGSTARALLTAKAALSFENIQRFWIDPAWRDWILARPDKPLPGPWDAHRGQPVDPASLNPDFGWLIRDRLSATEHFFADTDQPEDKD